MRKITIIGAGPAGLTAAMEISKDKNFKSILLEKSSFVGGMAKSFSIFNQTVDVGPHRFFSNDHRVNKTWIEVVENEYKMIDRVTRIYYKGKFYDYPLKPFNALKNLGIIEAFLCLFSYLIAQVKSFDTETFEGWVSSKFGKRLFNTFFKSYTEKLWGISCDNLSAEFAKQRIKNFSLGQAVINIFIKNNSKHKTLVDQFAYPIKGNGDVYEKMALRYKKNGGEINFNCDIRKIKYENSIFKVTTNDNLTYNSEYLISTMPITDFLLKYENCPENILFALKKLKFRNTIIVYTKINRENIFIDQWLYMQDEKIKSGRITNFNNWIPDICNNQSGTILALEYWCYEEDDLWNYNENMLFEIAKNDLLNCNFITNENQIFGYHCLKVPKCYPVYDSNYKESLDIIIEYIKSIKNLQLIGRYGSFKYNNQDHSILMGLLASENILKNNANDLWSINTDYEYHESSKITSTGLQYN